jgi:hypothetical protein
MDQGKSEEELCLGQRFLQVKYKNLVHLLEPLLYIQSGYFIILEFKGSQMYMHRETWLYSYFNTKLKFITHRLNASP